MSDEQDTAIALLEEIELDDEQIVSIIGNQMSLLDVLNYKTMRNENRRHGGSASGRSRNIEREFPSDDMRFMLDYFWPVDQQIIDGKVQFGPFYDEDKFERRFSVSQSF